MTTTKLQLVPDEDTKATRLFNDEKDYQNFTASFQNDVKVELDRQREARRQSEEQAKKLLIS